ncbi:MAG: hypothetical protein ACR2QW_20675, partial [bacterium]
VLLSAAGILLYYVSAQSLRYINVIAPEALYFFASSLFAAALWEMATRPLAKWRILIAGFTLGLCIAVKFLFLAWVPALLVYVWILARHRTITSRLFALIRCGTGAMLGFFGATFSAAPVYAEMLGWLTSLAAREGPYGSGATGWPEPANLLGHWLQAIQSAKGWYLLLLAIFIACLLGLVRWHKTRTKIPQGMLELFIFILIALLCSHLLLARTVDLHYLLPMAMLGVIAFAVAVHLWQASLRGWRIFPIVLIVSILLIKSFSLDINIHHRWTEKGIALNRELEQIVNQYDSRQPPIVIYSFRVPQASFANRLYAPEDYQTRLDEIYPYEGHYLPWSQTIRLPSDAEEWDLLVIRDKDLSGFPGEEGTVIGRAGGYLVVRPANR